MRFDKVSVTSAPGKCFVWTNAGIKFSLSVNPDISHERKVGYRIAGRYGFRKANGTEEIPAFWLERGWVEQVDIKSAKEVSKHLNVIKTKKT